MEKENIIQLMKSRLVTRDELTDMLGLNSDPATREWVRQLNDELRKQGLCILSSAHQRGYRIPDPNDPDDVTKVKNAIRELENKALSILHRRRVLKDFVKHSENLPTLFQL